MVKLQLLITPYITGYVHVQTNPKLSYSQAGMVKNAESKRFHQTQQSEAKLIFKQSDYCHISRTGTWFWYQTYLYQDTRDMGRPLCMSHPGSKRYSHSRDNHVLHGASSIGIRSELHLYRALYQRVESPFWNRVCKAVLHHEQADLLIGISTIIRLSHSAAKLKPTIMQTIIALVFLLRPSLLQRKFCS